MNNINPPWVHRNCIGNGPNRPGIVTCLQQPTIDYFWNILKLQMTYFERVWRRWVWRNIGLLCVQVSRIVIIFLRIFNKGRLLFPPFFIFFYFLLLKFQRDWISFFIIPLLFGGDKLWCGCGCVDVQVKLWVMIGVCMTLAGNGRWYVSSIIFCLWCYPQPLLFLFFSNTNTDIDTNLW